MNQQCKDEFFEAGYLDFKNGIDYDECPWDEGTDGEFGWKQGWKHASRGESKNESRIIF